VCILINERQSFCTTVNDPSYDEGGTRNQFRFVENEQIDELVREIDRANTRNHTLKHGTFLQYCVPPKLTQITNLQLRIKTDCTICWSSKRYRNIASGFRPRIQKFKFFCGLRRPGKGTAQVFSGQNVARG
jgi:hypothetical protein